MIFLFCNYDAESYIVSKRIVLSFGNQILFKKQKIWLTFFHVNFELYIHPSFFDVFRQNKFGLDRTVKIIMMQSFFVQQFNRFIYIVCIYKFSKVLAI